MIPASYMFKDIYHQHWEVGETEAAPARPAPRGGIAIPMRDIAALLGRAVEGLRRRPVAAGQVQPCP